MADKLTKKFLEQLNNFVKDRQPEKIWLACSGGPDSLALLWLLADNLPPEISLNVLHVWHNLRAEAEAEYYKLAASLPKRVQKFKAFYADVKAYAHDCNLSAEVAARELRRSAYAYCTNGEEKAYVCLAQHADDQAETIILHACKGSGMNGLCGIASLKRHLTAPETVKQIKNAGYLKLVTGTCATERQFSELSASTLNNACFYTAWRPLLPLLKKELLEYVKARKLNYSVDRTNYDPHYERNFIRLQLLPALTERFPQTVEKLGNLGATVERTLQATDYLLANNAQIKKVRDLSDVQKLEAGEKVLALSFLAADNKSDFLTLPETVRNLYLERQLHNKFPDLLLSRTQYNNIQRLFNLALYRPCKDLRLIILRKDCLMLLIDRLLLIYSSPHFNFSHASFDRSLIYKKCRKYFLEHYAVLLPLKSNWRHYYRLSGELPENMCLRTMLPGDYFNVNTANSCKHRLLSDYLHKSNLPEFLWPELMVLSEKNSRHLYHLFYKNLTKWQTFSLLSNDKKL